jgi:hypothetical protein
MVCVRLKVYKQRQLDRNEISEEDKYLRRAGQVRLGDDD